MASHRTLFSIEEERYLLNQITSSDSLVTQKALQWLHDRLAGGFRFTDPQGNPNPVYSAVGWDCQNGLTDSLKKDFGHNHFQK